MTPQAPLPEDNISKAENILLLLNFIQHYVDCQPFGNTGKFTTTSSTKHKVADKLKMQAAL